MLNGKYSSDYVQAESTAKRAGAGICVVSSPRPGSGVQNTANLVRGHRDG